MRVSEHSSGWIAFSGFARLLSWVDSSIWWGIRQRPPVRVAPAVALCSASEEQGPGNAGMAAKGGCVVSGSLEETESGVCL